jgi:hypothetical protein
MTTKKKLIDTYEEWLSSFKWNLFGTLTFRRPNMSSWKANQIFDRWIGEMQEEHGTFRWVRATEKGANGDHLHFHVLIGGLKHGSKWPWILLWDELAGDCIISYYTPSRGGLRYLLKEVRADQEFAIEFDFDLPVPPKEVWGL